MKQAGFPRCLRLRRRWEYLRVQSEGTKHHMRHFLVFVARVWKGGVRAAIREPLAPRLGVTVTRKVGGAVARNRIKRLVRDAFRRCASRYPRGVEMVWIAKRDAAGVGHDRVLRDMETMCRRLETGRQPESEGTRR